MSVLNLVVRVRRNHALEHATIHLLNRRYPEKQLMGWSTPYGFYIYGDVPTSAVENTIHEASSRLNHGESSLAIHPRCGTNLVTASTLVGLVAFLTMLPNGKHPRRTRLPLVLVASTLTMLFAQPLGLAVQEYITTDAHHPGIPTIEIERGMARQVTVHKVRVTYGG